jgi:hypothetical protein
VLLDCLLGSNADAGGKAQGDRRRAEGDNVHTGRPGAAGSDGLSGSGFNEKFGTLGFRERQPTKQKLV